MAEPIVTMYFETAGGTANLDTTPANWTQVTSGVSKFHGTGVDTTINVLDPFPAPVTGEAITSELWIDVLGTGATYAQVPNYGDGTKQFNFCVRFADNPCSSRPRIEAWDDVSDLGAGTAPANEILTGTVGNSNKSMVRVYDATASAGGATWWTSSTKATDTANNKQLCGNTSYLIAQADKIADSEWYLQLALVIPSDAGAGTTGHTFVLAVRYFYT